MDEHPREPVVVAVGHEPVDAAVAYAVAEAERAGCGVHLVHVGHLFTLDPQALTSAETAVEQRGRELLATAGKVTRDLAPASMPLTAELVIGSVVPSLVDAAHAARLVVLVHRDLSRARRLVTRSIAGGVAARARVPVVSVPADWSTGTGRRTRVTVGIDVPDRSEHALLAAAAEARARDLPLHVVHAWRFPGAYDDIVMSGSEARDWTAHLASEVRSQLAHLGDALAGVTVEVDVHHGFAVDALLAASRTAALLVIGRHDPLLPLGSHLGPVARAVLREAACPVLLADPTPR